VEAAGWGAGAEVTGCDIAVNWLEKARTRAAAEKEGGANRDGKRGQKMIVPAPARTT